MNSINLTLNNSTLKILQNMLDKATKSGNLAEVNRIKAIIAFGMDYTKKTISDILNVSTESVRIWINKFILRAYFSRPRIHGSCTSNWPFRSRLVAY